MRHTINLLLGADLKAFVARHAQYIYKYSEDGAENFSRTKSWLPLDDGRTEIKTAELDGAPSDSFVSSTRDLYTTRLTDDALLAAENRDRQLRSYFTKLHQQTVTINNAGDSSSLLLPIFVPLYDKALCVEVSHIVEAVSSITPKYTIAVIGFCSDLRPLLSHLSDNDTTPEDDVRLAKAEQENIQQLATLRQGTNAMEQFIVLQNTNQAGFALSLDEDSLVRITGELSLLMVEKYDCIFLQSTTFDLEHPVSTLGLSVMNLDKYYLANYLLRRSYLHILEKENVDADTVDINKVAIIANGLLKKHVNLFSNFYNAHILPRVRAGEDHERILSETAAQLRSELDSVAQDLTSYILEGDLTLPEKQALQALVMGYDDRLMRGNLFNHNQLSIDHLDQEVADVFLAENNSQVKVETLDDGKKVYTPGLIDVCMDDECKVTLPIEELRDLRFRIREATNYIRQKTDELHQIEQMTQDAEISEKRLTEQGFVVDGQLYRFDVAHTETLFDENYEPHQVTATSVDLRHGFTKIKDQGQIGACTVFSVTSIFEYIMKRVTSQEADLSESFVYYNVRHAEGREREDSGSSYQDVIKSIGERGICMETLHPYSKALSDAPSEEAFADGKTRRILKALNVPVDEQSIKSAIQDGHPVAVSLKVYNSFSSTTHSGAGSKVASTGFVKMPTPKELASSEFGYHAMVICGYSDETKHFVVRNSWGKHFGDKGYCYMPYAYICDKELNRMACIITEIDTLGTDVVFKDENPDAHTTVKFNMNDAHIKSFVIRNLIDEEKRNLARMQKEDLALRKDYETLMQKLGRQSLRNKLMEGRKERLRQDISNLRAEQIHINEEVRPKRLNEFDTTTRAARFYIILWNITFGLWWIIGSYGDMREWLQSTWCVVISILLGLGVIIGVLYWRWFKNARRRIEMELEEESAAKACLAAQKSEELKESQLKMHVAGMIVDSLLSLKHTLDEKYQAMKSYVGNLTVWQKEEKKASAEMEQLVKDPFIPLLSNETLNSYFEANKEKITGELHLYEYFKAYQLNDEAIIAYKRNLKQHILKHVQGQLADFTIFRHIFGVKVYPYLDNRYASAANLMPLLDRKSEPFCTLRSTPNTMPQARFLFIKTDEQENRAWQQEYPKYFATMPISEDIASNFKIVALRIQPLTIDQIGLKKF